MRLRSLGLAVAALLPSAGALAEPATVVTTVRPIHSLVAGVMGGVAEPGLLIAGGESPHTASLRPSQAAMLEAADLVVWVGPGLETFLEGTIETLAGDAEIVTLAERDDVMLLPVREGGDWEAHEDDEEDHGHEHEDEHVHDEEGHDEEGHDEEGHDEEGHDEEGHDDHHGHDHAGADAHLWLDPENGLAIVRAVEGRLAEIDPENAGAYSANADRMASEIEALRTELAESLAPVADVPTIVFHDAYQYFERAFGLSVVGSITLSPERQVSAARVTELQRRLAEEGVACVYAEPQFPPRLISTVVEGTETGVGTLDPLGADLEAGPGLYFELLRSLASDYRACIEEVG